MKLKITTLVAALAAVLAIGNVNAAAPKKEDSKATTETKPDSKEGAPKRDTYPLSGKVVSITSKTLIIKGGEGKEDRKFTVTAETVFVNGAKPATIDDVKVGATVGGLVKKATGDGNPTLVKLNVGVKQKADKPDAKDASKADAKSKSKPKKTE